MNTKPRREARVGPALLQLRQWGVKSYNRKWTEADVARTKHRKKSKPENSHNFINAEAIKTCSTGNSNNSGHSLCINAKNCSLYTNGDGSKTAKIIKKQR